MSSTIQTTNPLQTALQRITETPEFKRTVDEINRGARVVSISGLVASSARALALAALQRETGKLFAIVTQSNRDLEPWEGDLALLVLRPGWKEALRKRSPDSAGVGK